MIKCAKSSNFLDVDAAVVCEYFTMSRDLIRHLRRHFDSGRCFAFSESPQARYLNFAKNDWLVTELPTVRDLLAMPITEWYALSNGIVPRFMTKVFLLMIGLAYGCNFRLAKNLETPPSKTSCSISPIGIADRDLPYFFWGMSPNFGPKILSSFPLGTSSKELEVWMDSTGFRPAIASSYESFFPDGQAQRERSKKRRELESYLMLRGLWLDAPIGQSVFSIAWQTDEFGCISELYADAMHFHFNMP